MIDLSYWPFFLLAILGAIVANATGAGGGVVFVPAFNMLNMSGESIIATSFAIQCFGMTAGTLAWRNHARAQLMAANRSEDAALQKIWQQYWRLTMIFAGPAIIGVLCGQYLLALESAATVKLVFKAFSALFGMAILVTTVYVVRTKQLHKPPLDFAAMQWLAISVAWVGGLVTAWLSIGVGELVAVMLILMRFPVRFAIGVAVSVSAMCVWFGVQKYVWFQPTIDFNVLAFAGPAAIIGGTVAKRVVAYFSPVQVKVLIALWILISAVAM